MKKWLIVVVLIVGMAVCSQAAEEGKAAAKGKGKGKGQPLTKEEFVAQRKAGAEKKGIEFDQAKAEAQFDKMDKNQDGVLTADEMPKKKGKAKGKKKGKGKGKGKGNAQAPAE